VHTDTITAIATAPGHGAVAVIRVSGPRAISLCDRHFRGSRPLGDLPGGRLLTGWFAAGGEDLDEVVLSLFRAPRSYTGEDLVEISCHGGPSAGYILDALVAAGARPSQPGEFTKRAYLNGRIDLSQAEAVAAVIASSGRAAHRAALRLLKGGLRDRLEPLYQRGIAIQSRLEAAIEFPEDVESGDKRLREGYIAGPGGDRGEETTPSAAEIAALRKELNEVLRRAGRSDLLWKGFRVVLSGPVNAGKSSLFNALLDRERAIVTEEPGTTRDTLEGVLEMEGIPVTLVDTAGLREPSSRPEAEGTRRSMEERQTADLILEIRDRSEARPPNQEEIPPQADILTILNKSDLPAHPEWGGETPAEPLTVSAKTGLGIEALRTAIADRLRNSPPEEILLNLRQRNDLERALAGLIATGNLLKKNELPELISCELGEALRAVGGILGRDPSQELLEMIFSQFCIGK
jgi:tRNA modification GTPase